MGDFAAIKIEHEFFFIVGQTAFGGFDLKISGSPDIQIGIGPMQRQIEDASARAERDELFPHDRGARDGLALDENNLAAAVITVRAMIDHAVDIGVEPVETKDMNRVFELARLRALLFDGEIFG